MTYEPREYRRQYEVGPTKLGINSPLAGAMELFAHILGGQMDTAASLGLLAIGYDPADCAMTRPNLRVIQREGGTADVAASLDELQDFRSDSLQTPGFDSSLQGWSGTAHNHSFTSGDQVTCKGFLRLI